ncbi:MAG: 6-pyruvoyl-tetrahydropterin synthase-related protein [Candidatus Saelkia tenebricola]|nr:6-pyruvoyl-tetrahydropterin synthase-related protein [Candidatus Saelkia tenebricola]
MASHFATASYLKNTLLPQKQLIGWNPGNYCGFPMFQHYFPLPFILITGLSYIMPIEISFKLVSVLGIFLLPLVVYFAMRLLGQKFPTPAIAAVFSLPFLFAEGNSMWGGNILSNLAGEFAYQISFALSILFMASLFKNIFSLKNSVANGILLGLIGITHGIGLVFAVTCGLFFLTWPQGIGKRIFYLVKTYCLGIGFMAFWFLPFISESKWSTEYTPYWHISSFQEAFPPILWPYLAIVAIGTLAVIMLQIFKLFSTKHLHLNNSFLPLACLWSGIIITTTLYMTDWGLNISGIRFFPYIEFLPMVIAAIYTGNLTRRLHNIPLLLLIVCLATCIWVSNHSKQVSAWSEWNYSGMEAKNGWGTFKKINNFLKGNESDPRIAYEHSVKYNQFGTPRAFETLPYFSGRSTIEGLYLESSITSPFALYLQSEISLSVSHPLPQHDYTSVNLKNAIHHFRIFNVSHFIATSKKVKRQACSNPDLILIAILEDLEIYKVKSSRTGYVEPLIYQPVLTDIDNWREISYQWFKNYAPNKPFLLFADKKNSSMEKFLNLPIAVCNNKTTSNIIPGEPPHVQSRLYKDRIDIHTTKPYWPLLLKISYHSKWKCEGAVGPYLSSPSFMIIFPTQKNITVYFSKSKFEYIGLIITFCTILIYLILPIFIPFRHLLS